MGRANVFADLLSSTCILRTCFLLKKGNENIMKRTLPVRFITPFYPILLLFTCLEFFLAFPEIFRCLRLNFKGYRRLISWSSFLATGRRSNRWWFEQDRRNANDLVLKLLIRLELFCHPSSAPSNFRLRLRWYSLTGAQNSALRVGLTSPMLGFTSIWNLVVDQTLKKWTNKKLVKTLKINKLDL